MVTMTLLSFIVLGLLMMFNQTQRAFRAGMGQTDVLEGGRGAIDMLVRELEQLTPTAAANLPNTGKGGGQTPIVNFWSGYDPNFGYPALQFLGPSAGGTLFRTNIIRQFFLLTKFNQDWTAAFYRVQPDAAGSAVGSLYRYSAVWPRNTPMTVGYSLLSFNSGSTSVGLPTQQAYWSTNRVADGVIHLRLLAYDTNGVPLIPYNVQYLASAANPFRPSVNNASSSPWFPLPCDACFWSNTVPAYLELEMGILEPKALQHYRAIDPTTPAAQNYLSNHVGQVHLFRQRVAIRNVDFSAYR